MNCRFVSSFKDFKVEKYTELDAYNQALAYFGGDELAARVWMTYYARKDKHQVYLEASPEQSVRRIAHEVARIEAQYPEPMSEEEVEGLFAHFRCLVPSNSALANTGNENRLATLSGNFVIGIDGRSDSYGAICKIDEEEVQLLKRHSSLGHDLSAIRPKGLPVQNSGSESAGIVPYMQRYINSANEVTQGRKRGSLNLTLSVEHPDIESFVDLKNAEEKFIGGTLAVRMTDRFMEALDDDEYFVTRFPIGTASPIQRRTIDAQRILKKLQHTASRLAEPNLLFEDTIRREGPAEAYAEERFAFTSATPYGNQVLSNYESQHTVIINLTGYVESPFSDEARFDFERLKAHAARALRIADDFIDLDIEKIDSILAKLDQDPEDEELKTTEMLLWKKTREKLLRGRRVAVSVMGAADVLATLRLEYASEEGACFLEKVMKTIALSVYGSSVALARQRGAFPIYNAAKEEGQGFISRLREADGRLYDDMKKYGRRNISCTAVIPSGGLSLIAQTTPGIEPLYKAAYKRLRKVTVNDNDQVDHINARGVTFEEVLTLHPAFRQWMEQNSHLTGRRYTDNEIQRLIGESPFAQVSVSAVAWEKKTALLGRLQRWVDQNISTTINLGAGTSENTIGKLYRRAWECGCKSCSVYVEGTVSASMLNAQRHASDFADDTPPIQTIKEKRPRILEADIVRFTNNEQPWVAFVGLLDGRPYEIFTGMLDEEEGILLPKSVQKGHIIKDIDDDGNKRYDFRYENKRGCKVVIEGLSEKFNKIYWNYAKLISGVLRYRMPIPLVIKLVTSLQLDDKDINTWKNGVVKALKNYQAESIDNHSLRCPSCGSDNMTYQEGGMLCKQCGRTNLI